MRSTRRATDSARRMRAPPPRSATVDGAIGRLRDEFAALGQPVNFVIVADHGMAAISNDRLIVLDTFSNADDYDVVEDGVYASVNPKPGKEAAVEKALLGPHGAHLTCYRKAEVPERFHYGRNPRVPAILCMPETGWTVVAHPPKYKVEGARTAMTISRPTCSALFIASGPAIRPLGKLAPFDNVDVGAAAARLDRLAGGQDLDGDDAPFRAALGR